MMPFVNSPNYEKVPSFPCCVISHCLILLTIIFMQIRIEIR
jgi:hypothetical protein